MRSRIPTFSANGFSLLLQVIADAEGAPPPIYEEKSARVAAIGMSSNPFCNLAAEVGRNRNIAVALVGLCSPNAILPSLTLLDRFVDSELWPSKSSMRKARASPGRNPHTARRRSTRCSRCEAAERRAWTSSTLRNRSQGFFWMFGIASFRAGFLGMRSSSIAYSKDAFKYGANVFDCGLGVPVLRHLVHQQLKGRERDLAGRVLPQDRQHVFVEQVFQVLSHLLAPGARLHG